MSSSDLRFVGVVLLLCFLFIGEPDVWDNLHKYVMSVTETNLEK